ncbi:DNA-binding protein Ikaros [Aplysia californica]|uniref:DNA-binding protein Ikaros n=1 Tax=Aplysia californica TaxID=6500 RepID=A0ABM1ADL2_APLCA|nr:DNA-binding protein Ikaros [Aplysia californica]
MAIPTSQPPHSVGIPSQPPQPISPEEQEAHRLRISKHEPIQNIIGRHPHSDILYLICRLCRQTYGSPYGFRKHFRNQHGFEPKEEHTIVQTISATKTARAHTIPLDQLDSKVLSSLAIKEERASTEELSGESGNVKSSSGWPHSAGSTDTPPGDSEQGEVVKKSLSEDTKYLECVECGETFQLNDFGSYKRHCRQHSMNRSSGPFACHDCKKSFSEPAHLQEHLDTHSTFTASVCGICHTFFSSPNYLAEHLQAAHGHVYIPSDKTASEGDSIDLKVENSGGGHSETSADGQDKGVGVVKTGAVVSLSSSSSSMVVVTSAVTSLSQLQASNISSSPSPATSSSSPSMYAPLPLSKRHRMSQSSLKTPLFTVHTPKGLEVQKLPADAVVTTASPDSSYDEARFNLDSQPGSSTGGGSGTKSSTAATPDANNASSDSDMVRDSVWGGDGGKSHCTDDVRMDIGNVILNLPKQPEDGGLGKSGNRDDTESNSSERCASVDSNSLSMEGSRASSPRGEDAEKYYKHKKYSRHRKRLSSSEVGSEPETKLRKGDVGTPPATPPTTTSATSSRVDQSVTSSVTCSVTLGDCESSSCSHSECPDKSQVTDSSSTGSEDGKGGKGQVGDGVAEKSSKSGNTTTTSNVNTAKEEDKKGADFSKNSSQSDSSDGGAKFKWERLTRSQAGKTSQPVSYNTS